MPSVLFMQLECKTGWIRYSFYFFI